MRVIISVIILIIVLSQSLSGQSTDSYLETTAGTEPLLEVFDLYFPDHHVKKIYGRPYDNPYPKADVHQFFKSKKPFTGIIFTISDTIHCTEILYDLFRDEIIVYAPAVRSYIELEGAFILQFSLYDLDGDHVYEFVHPGLGSDSTEISESGFLQVLYRGERTGLYKRHFKIFTVDKEGLHSEIRFKKKENLVLRKGNETYLIKRNRNLLQLYPEARHDIRKFLRSSRIYVQQASDEQIKMAGHFLDDVGRQHEINVTVQ